MKHSESPNSSIIKTIAESKISNNDEMCSQVRFPFPHLILITRYLNSSNNRIRLRSRLALVTDLQRHNQQQSSHLRLEISNRQSSRHRLVTQFKQLRCSHQSLSILRLLLEEIVLSIVSFTIEANSNRRSHRFKLRATAELSKAGSRRTRKLM